MMAASIWTFEIGAPLNVLTRYLYAMSLLVFDYLPHFPSPYWLLYWYSVKRGGVN